MPCRLAQQQERSLGIDPLDALEGLEVHLLQSGNHSQSGVNNYQVDAAPLLADRIESLRDGNGIGYVEGGGDHSLTEFLFQLLAKIVQRGGWQVGERDMAALLQQSFGDRGANCSRGPGYQRNLTPQKRFIGPQLGMLQGKVFHFE